MRIDPGGIMELLQAADGYPTASAAELGLDTGAVRTLVERAERDVTDGNLPSCQLALAKDGKLAAFATLGDAEPAGRYVLFSCTKALTGAAVWILLGDGSIKRDQRVVDVFPEFGANGKDQITVEQLLTHTSGFPYAPMTRVDWGDRDRRVARMAGWRLNWEPGSRFEYHSSSAHWVLAELIERVSDTDYRTFVNSRICEPLDLRMRLGESPQQSGDVNPLVTFGERPSPDQMAELGLTGWDPGEVVAENLERLSDHDVIEVGIPAGGAIATAADLALFYQALLHDDLGLWDPDVLRAGTAEVVFDTDDLLLGIPANRTLGITLAGDDGKAAWRGFGHTVSGAAFGHGGAGGQIGWADPESGLSFGYVTNGYDSYVPHQWRRTAGLSSKAGACADRPQT